MGYEQLQDTYFVTRTIKGVPVKFAIEELWSHDCRITDAYGDYLHEFETGELINAVILVKAHALGITGTDYLSGCHVASKKLESELSEMIDDQDMVDNAIDCWAEILVRQLETLQPFFNRGE